MNARIIVDSMTIEEILDLYGQEDAIFVNHKIKELTKKYSKSLPVFRTEKYFFKPVEYKRKDGMNVVIQCFDLGATYPTGKRLRTISYNWFIYKGGMYAIKLIPESSSSTLLYIFTQHFIERYRERVLKDTSITKTDALNLFIRRNHKIIGKKIPSERHPDNFWLCYDDGVSYISCRFYKKFNLHFSELTMKTFISWGSLSLHRKNISLSLFENAIARGFDVKIPDEILDEIEL